jgi:hypothetical protein
MSDETRPTLPALNTRALSLAAVPRELIFRPRLGEEDPASALALINERFALAPLSPEQVELRRMALAHSALDRTHERFSPAFLTRLAASLPGKPVLAHHDHKSWPLGRFWAAEVVEEPRTGVHWLVARWYLLKTAENETLRGQIDAGIVAHVSIGFRGGELICDLCGEPFWGDCPHWPGQEVTRNGAPVTCTFVWQDPRGSAEAVEGSLVWLGAQQGAQVIKQAGSPPNPPIMGGALAPPIIGGLGGPETEDGMNDTATLAELRRALAAAVGELLRLRERAAEAAPLARDGRLYRDDLEAEIRRLAGLLDASGEAAVLCAALEAAGAPALKRARDEYQRRVDARYPPAGTALPAAGPADTTARARDLRAHTLV